VRVTVTGGAGFIGGHLVDRLLAEGHQVTVLVRSPSAIPAIRQKGAVAVRGDVTDPASLGPAMTGCEILFNLARARPHGSRPRTVFEVNAGGATNVARAAARAGVGRLVQASSSAVYGSRCGLVDETAPLRTDSAYARSKKQAEEAVRRECGQVATVCARITAVLGPRCRSWLHLFRSARAGRLRLVGDGSNMHHPADVSDIVDGLMLCAFMPAAAGGIYNLAGPEPVSIAALRAIMADASGVSGAAPTRRKNREPVSYPRALLDLYYHAGRLSDSMVGLRPPLFESVSFLMADRVLDISKAKRELGYAPRISVMEGARRTADWYSREGLL
jgi:nucleoside-diphosphate-sugar epimerase